MWDTHSTPGLVPGMRIKSWGGYSVCPQCAHSLAEQRPRKHMVTLQAEKKCGENSKPGCSARAGSEDAQTS